jgi:hypothetical protein
MRSNGPLLSPHDPATGPELHSVSLRRISECKIRRSEPIYEYFPKHPPFGCSDQSFVIISDPFHACYMSSRLILVDLIILLRGELDKVWRTSLRSSLQPLLIISLSTLNIYFCISLSLSLSQTSTLGCKNSSYIPHKATNKLLLSILFFTC